MIERTFPRARPTPAPTSLLRPPPHAQSDPRARVSLSPSASAPPLSRRGSVVPRLLGQRSMSPADFVSEYLQTQYLSPEELRPLQLVRLRRLMWHCLRYVPGYRRLLLYKLGRNVPLLLARLEHPSQLPLLPLQELLDRPQDFRATGFQGPAPIDPSGEWHAQALETRAAGWLDGPCGPKPLPPALRHDLLGLLAAPCKHGQLHISAERLLLEVLGDRGEPLPLGVTGRLVGTDLCNLSAPLLRAPLRMSGRLSAPRCSCGVSLLVLEDPMRWEGP